MKFNNSSFTLFIWRTKSSLLHSLHIQKKCKLWQIRQTDLKLVFSGFYQLNTKWRKMEILCPYLQTLIPMKSLSYFFVKIISILYFWISFLESSGNIKIIDLSWPNLYFSYSNLTVNMGPSRESTNDRNVILLCTVLRAASLTILFVAEAEIF